MKYQRKFRRKFPRAHVPHRNTIQNLENIMNLSVSIQETKTLSINTREV
jgi:hypothetical protein